MIFSFPVDPDQETEFLSFVIKTFMEQLVLVKPTTCLFLKYAKNSSWYINKALNIKPSRHIIS